MTKQKIKPKYIVFDTNMVYDDLLLKGRVIEAIVRYANLTRSIVVVPSVIKMELKKRYEEAWRKEVARLEEVNKKFDGLVDITQHETDAMEKFASSWNQFIKRVRSKEVDSSKVALTDLIDRSIKEKKPFGGKSKGFRDALIWHTIIDFLKETDGKREMVLLSKNTDDFGKSGLHEDLEKEATQAGYRVLYYSSLGQMLEMEGGAVGFINDEYIENDVVTVISDQIIELANAKTEYFDGVMQERIRSQLDDIWELELLHMDVLEVETYEYYIYAEDDNYYHLHHDAKILLMGEYRALAGRVEGDIVNTLENQMVDTFVTSYVKINKKDRSVVYAGSESIGELKI